MNIYFASGHNCGREFERWMLSLLLEIGFVLRVGRK